MSDAHGASVALAKAAGVAFPVAITGLKKPGKAALPEDSAPTSVEIAVPELHPWRIRADFLWYWQYGKWRTVEYEYVPIGIALKPPDISIDAANSVSDPIAERARAVGRLFARNVETYTYLAELALRFDKGELEGIRLAMLEGKQHRHHRLVVALFRSLKGEPRRVSEMADMFNVERTAIHRSLDEAVEMGLITAEERGRRRKSAAA